MSKLKDFLCKVIARIADGNAILWENHSSSTNEQFEKPVKNNIFARRYPVCVVQDTIAGDYHMFVHDLNDISVTLNANAVNDPDTVDEILEEFQNNSVKALEEFIKQGLALPEPSSFEQIKHQIEKDLVNKLVCTHSIGVMVVTN